eukprot:gnl/MRDRNA2_/MRDRNA2_57316_c0_seq1.p1 gnl/MRDRNA2_/MRDRNA2_57316_c0~~gnl/MRDRNA2_/MRDRNA2_57316_c0_seq1.p1  ORF type:complete len:319 (-),score=35.76 gnl/MRDRNA2_/MRDRNA2_57316_c0_seq1:281-1237(-)
MIPHIVNARNLGTSTQTPSTSPQAKRRPPYQELHRFGSVANTVAFSAGTMSYDQPKEPVPHSADTCFYILVALIINYCCLGVLHCVRSATHFGENSKRLQIICGSAHVVVPLGVLIYLWLASPVLDDMFAGKLTGAWCVLLLVSVVFQITCGLCLCSSAFCGFDVGNWSVGAMGSDTDWKFWKRDNNDIVLQSASPSYTVHTTLATPTQPSQPERSSIEVLLPNQKDSLPQVDRKENDAPAKVDSEDKATAEHAPPGAASSPTDSFSATAGDKASGAGPTLKRSASAFTMAFRALSNAKPRPRLASSEPTSPRPTATS